MVTRRKTSARTHEGFVATKTLIDSETDSELLKASGIPVTQEDKSKLAVIEEKVSETKNSVNDIKADIKEFMKEVRDAQLKNEERFSKQTIINSILGFIGGTCFTVVVGKIILQIIHA